MKVSHRFQQDAETGKPLPRKGPKCQNKERVMMKLVIILVIRLVISFQAY
ncbi:type I toxin-antitoxin system Ibs family toxin [Salmonella bongori]|nr:type I toxin-antitoxin system Ibs family toxin [Salmonella bongori serovar 48:i:-]ECG9254449.1 type I toxin-antitoxin system Ibs family toxin [Salmonella bongori]MBA2165905.1 type I toxin-antitoxin system Ibs family toxin [Salmonella bongori serovar 48:z81:-]EDP8706855.1 type I toxin-antitoxin system Ibs family toxin [Salmonella bongori]EDP8724688.1 type I toxin-antitoxin system Ibs family toxin [Salmonella bongori]